MQPSQSHTNESHPSRQKESPTRPQSQPPILVSVPTAPATPATPSTLSQAQKRKASMDWHQQRACNTSVGTTQKEDRVSHDVYFFNQGGAVDHSELLLKTLIHEDDSKTTGKPLAESSNNNEFSLLSLEPRPIGGTCSVIDRDEYYATLASPAATTKPISIGAVDPRPNPAIGSCLFSGVDLGVLFGNDEAMPDSGTPLSTNGELFRADAPRRCLSDGEMERKRRRPPSNTEGMTSRVEEWMTFSKDQAQVEKKQRLSLLVPTRQKRTVAQRAHSCDSIMTGNELFGEGLFWAMEPETSHDTSGAKKSTDDYETASAASFSSSNSSNKTTTRFRNYQNDQWRDRFDDCMQFRRESGHCLVPHSFPENPKLAQWVKRQRYQFKLKRLGRHTTLTEEREDLLNKMGFVWDSHEAAWSERMEALRQYKADNGDCNVPANYADKPLAIWVKCQRRQLKLWNTDQKSSLNEKRVADLEGLGFDWNPRKLPNYEKREKR